MISSWFSLQAHLAPGIFVQAAGAKPINVNCSAVLVVCYVHMLRLEQPIAFAEIIELYWL